MKKPKSKVGTCEYHLCKKKTRVFFCRYCGRYFCKKHLRPKPALSLKQIHSTREPLRSKLEEIWRSEEGHPDYIYTPEFWKELEEEEERRREKIREILDKLKKPREEIKQPIQKEKVITIPLELIIAALLVALFGLFLYFNFNSSNQPAFSQEPTTTIIIQKESQTTTTLKETKKYFVDLNFSTPFPRINKTFFVNNFFSVYINDSLLKIIDPNYTGFYNKSMEAIKKAFKIWEEETKLVSFKFVGAEENYTLYVEITAEMPVDVMEKEFVSYAVGYTIPRGYECGNYFFITGGKIYLSPKREQELLKIALHEIGHILNLADVGNRDSIMCKWSEEEALSEDVLRKRITQEIKETLKMIVKPEYNCGIG